MIAVKKGSGCYWANWSSRDSNRAKWLHTESEPRVRGREAMQREVAFESPPLTDKENFR